MIPPGRNREYEVFVGLSIEHKESRGKHAFDIVLGAKYIASVGFYN